MSFPEFSRWRPRFSVGWGAGISLLGWIFAWLTGETTLQIIFGLLLIVLGFTLALRRVGLWRRRMLWGLRNRLLVTYVFIAVIPILLILGMVGLTSYLLYGQLAGYLFAHDLEGRALELGKANLALAGELAGQGSQPDATLQRRLENERAFLADEFPGLALGLRRNRLLSAGPLEPSLCDAVPEWAAGRFRAVTMAGRELFLHSAVSVPGQPEAVLCLTVPVNESLLAQVAADLGQFDLILLEEVTQRPESGTVFNINERTFLAVRTLRSPERPMPPAEHFLDPVLSGFSKFNVVHWEPEAAERRESPVLISLATRPSLLNRRLFSPLGEVAQALVAALVVIGVLFLLLELASLITGVRLTRSITASVGDLYAATQRLQRGDFSVRVPHRRDDQLGALGDSFNQMAGSLERLVEESKERQRLEQELEIARQVQEQLFPGKVPELKTLELIGHCRPARRVSGDYYDYGLAEPGKLLFTIGDISGKGISAALLMATIQSILRSHGYASRLTGRAAQLGPAELVTRVNRQLCATTSSEKYSTLFVASYDDAARRLTYTNAGHLPPILLGNGLPQELSTGGTVVGLFSDAGYEEATLVLQPGQWFVAFTDGLTEVENSYEEEYGRDRLLAFLRRAGDRTSPVQLIESLLAELELWAPGVEQRDDCTILAARVR